MVGEACLPSNAYYPRTPDYTLCSGVHVCWSEHSDSSFVYGFMILNYGFGTMTATTLKHWLLPHTVLTFLLYIYFFKLLCLDGTFRSLSPIEVFNINSLYMPFHRLVQERQLLLASSLLTEWTV